MTSCHGHPANVNLKVCYSSVNTRLNKGTIHCTVKIRVGMQLTVSNFGCPRSQASSKNATIKDMGSKISTQ